MRLLYEETTKGHGRETVRIYTMNFITDDYDEPDVETPLTLKRRDGRSLPDSITMPGRNESLQELVTFVCDHAGEALFTEDRISEVKSGMEEALRNIIGFACPSGSEAITVKCAIHEMGALLVDIVDDGKPFNMLVESALPENPDPRGAIPHTGKMKKTMKNIEYRRDGKKNKNILACVISK
jgi:anti-sigma regulatory factor (Ser/Thr protein kinase)